MVDSNGPDDSPSERTQALNVIGPRRHTGTVPPASGFAPPSPTTHDWPATPSEESAGNSVADSQARYRFAPSGGAATAPRPRASRFTFADSRRRSTFGPNAPIAASNTRARRCWSSVGAGIMGTAFATRPSSPTSGTLL